MIRTLTARRLSQRPGSAVTLGVGTSLVGTLQDARTLVPRLHVGAGGDPFANTAKGVLGETMAHALVHDGLLAGSGWASLSPAGANNGIDGLYLRVDGSGRIRGLLVAEAKTYGSRLNSSQGGQMGPTWLARWLDKTAARYAGVHDLTAGVPPAGAQTLDVPLGRGTARVWLEDGRWRTDGDPRQVGPACARIGRYLDAASERLITYRARIFRYSVSGDRHVLSVRDVDPSTGEKGARDLIVSGRFEDLTPFQQRLLREAFRAYFRALGQSDANLDALVDKACHDPGFAKNFQVKAKWWLLGLTPQNLLRSGFAGALAGLLDVGAQWLGGEGVDWRRAVGIAGLTFGATMTGLVAGAHVTSLVQGRAVQRLLARTAMRAIHQARLASALGGFAAGALAAAAIAYGGLLVGRGDWAGAHRMALTGVAQAGAGAAVAPVAFAVAHHAGVAGTGTAIGTLAGAAKTSATLAWIGSSVGGGAAAGATILSGGAFAAVVVTGIAVHKAFAALDERERMALVEGRIRLAGLRLA